MGTASSRLLLSQSRQVFRRITEGGTYASFQGEQRGAGAAPGTRSGDRAQPACQRVLQVQGETAIDNQVLTGDEGRGRAAQESDHLGHFFSGPHSAQGSDRLIQVVQRLVA